MYFFNGWYGERFMSGKQRKTTLNDFLNTNNTLNQGGLMPGFACSPHVTKAILALSACRDESRVYFCPEVTTELNFI